MPKAVSRQRGWPRLLLRCPACVTPAIAQQPSARMIEPQRFKRLAVTVRISTDCETLQPVGIVALPHKGLEQPYRHPFMPVVVAFAQAGVFNRS